MKKLNYCVDCQRVFLATDKCEYCKSGNVKELKRGKSVNIIGSKNKGSFLKYKEGMVSVIIYTEDKKKILKDFSVESVRKII